MEKNIKLELKELLIESPDLVIRRMEELLSPSSPLIKQIIALKANYRSVIQQRLRGTIANETVQIELNKISKSLLVLIDELESSDFEGESSGGSSKKSTAKGFLLYRIPHSLRGNTPEQCIVRIAYHEHQLLEGWTISSDDVMKSIRITRLMAVDLIGMDGKDSLKIRSINNVEQIVDEDSYTEWHFYVQAAQLGELNLGIRISIIDLVDGKKVRRETVNQEVLDVRTVVPEQEESFRPSPFTLQYQAPPAPVPEEIKPPKPPKQIETTQPEVLDVKTVVPEQEESLRPTSFTVNMPDEAPPVPVPKEIEPPKPPDQIETTQPEIKTNFFRRYVLRYYVFLPILVSIVLSFYFLTPPPTRDWVVARYINNNSEAYNEYIIAHGNDNAADLEKAFYRKAILASDMNTEIKYLNAYLEKYPQGRYSVEAKAAILKFEKEYLADLRKDPTDYKVQQFVVNFPKSDQIAEITNLANGEKILALARSFYSTPKLSNQQYHDAACKWFSAAMQLDSSLSWVRRADAWCHNVNLKIDIRPLITGQVLNDSTGLPLAGVRITGLSTDTYSDSQGRYTLKLTGNLNSPLISLRFALAGSAAVSKQFNVESTDVLPVFRFEGGRIKNNSTTNLNIPSILDRISIQELKLEQVKTIKIGSNQNGEQLRSTTLEAYYYIISLNQKPVKVVTDLCYGKSRTNNSSTTDSLLNKQAGVEITTSDNKTIRTNPFNINNATIKNNGAWKIVLCDDSLNEELVAFIKNFLKQKGYPISNSKKWDAQESLYEYQQKNNLPVGNIDFETLESLGFKIYMGKKQ